VCPGSPRQPHGTEEFEREAVGEIFIGEIDELTALGGAGVIHQDVNASELADREVDDTLAGFGLPQIESNCFRGSTGGADLGHSRVEQWQVARSQNNGRTGGGQTDCDGASDPAARSGNDRDLAL
jgi:hypothetical protein